VTATIKKTDLVFCSCGCEQVKPEAEMVYDDNDDPYISYEHMAEAQVETMVARWDMEDFVIFGENAND